jgi:hypothetical protein
MAKELTTNEKWGPIDYIIKRIRENREAGIPAYEYPIDEYIDKTFGDGKTDDN